MFERDLFISLDFGSLAIRYKTVKKLMDTFSPVSHEKTHQGPIDRFFIMITLYQCQVIGARNWSSEAAALAILKRECAIFIDFDKESFQNFRCNRPKYLLALYCITKRMNWRKQGYIVVLVAGTPTLQPPQIQRLLAEKKEHF